ncbi:MAG: efflux transporter outer membrane subunit [Betaproteobacteria bacterium]|nr:efflux transporter outer membrane subunit [Betaproteobacteria bacterium]
MRVLTLAALAAIAGCAPVGPNFKPPDPPQAERYTESALPAQTASADAAGGPSQRYAPGTEIPADWWELFRSEALGRLVRMAIADSPTLDAARAALVQAQETLNAQYSVLYPSVDASAGARRQRTTGASFGLPSAQPNLFTLYNASVNVSYAIDVAGGARRELESLLSQIDYQRLQLEAAYLSLTGNVVTAAVQEASLRAQIRATREVARSQEQTLSVVEKQFDLGAVSRAEVLAQRTQLAQTLATLPPLEKALAQTRNALAALVGHFPAEAGLPESELAQMQLPQELPLSLPSALARQRPDIRAAEALLHRASAEIGVAEAAKYPQLTLSAAYGSAATRSASLFGSQSMIWNLGASLLAPIFHAGKLEAQKRAAIAAYDQALAQYRQTVLAAFRNVADVLEALEGDARALKAQAEAEASARASLELARAQFELGAASYLVLLNAERQAHQARIGLVQAQAARFADTAALYQALGGGWWGRTENIEKGSVQR